MGEDAQYLFYVGDALPPNQSVPWFRLQPDHWDDFGQQTLFHLTLTLPDEDVTVAVGKVKILSREPPDEEAGVRRSATMLPRAFNELSSQEFCSLGQTSTYYFALAGLARHETAPITASQVVEALADVGFVDPDDGWWLGDDRYQSSLLRFATAYAARRDAAALLRGESPTSDDSASLPLPNVLTHVVKPPAYDFRFDATTRLPGRVNVLVGRNGSGKTTLLADLADDLARTLHRGAAWHRYLPEFTKVIFVSNTLLDADRLAYLVRDTSRRYEIAFIGLAANSRVPLDAAIQTLLDRAESGEPWAEVLAEVFPDPAALEGLLPAKNESALVATLVNALEAVSGDDEWRRFAKDHFDDEGLWPGLVDEPRRTVLHRMSAGHRSLALVYAGLFREVDRRSLVLLDEPENFLHPSLISRFHHQLSDLLERRKAFGIVATHSPVFVQETARRFVTVIERAGATDARSTQGRRRTGAWLSRPQFETFGESIDNLTEYLFGVDFRASNWRSVLVELAKAGCTDEYLAEMLGHKHRLPPLARTFLELARARHADKVNDS
ncbi:MAG: AAA family ATPase [Myxococcales bacterium]|nr:AAA family ATPase [Myxococcales bacterium]